jgi:hypothetical protein
VYYRLVAAERVRPQSSSNLPPELRRRLDRTRSGLLRVHKALLDEERVWFERAEGRAEGNAEFLQIVIHHSWFAWLRPVSELVALIDATLASSDPVATGDAEALVIEARRLLRPDENGDAFQRRYYRAMQQTPEVVLAHADALRLIGKDV